MLSPESTALRGARVMVVASNVAQARRLRSAVATIAGVHAQGARSLREAADAIRDARVDVVATEASAWDSCDGELATALEANPGVGAVVVGAPNPVISPETRALTMSVVHDIDELPGELASVIERARVMRRRETMVRWLEREAHTDTLTGLNNRRAFDEQLFSACSEGRAVGLLLINVIGTGTVNYNYGEETGDRLLRHAATGIMRSVRAEDTAARLGEDNFAIIVRDSDIDLCRRIARRIAHQIELLNRTEWAGDIPVAVTFGLACGAGCSAEDLFIEAGRELTLERAFMPAPPEYRGDDGPSVA